MNQVIVLNADMTVLNTVHVKRAWKYVAKKKASIVKMVEGVPKVVKMLSMVVAMHRAGVPWTKTNVHVRDKFTCKYCGKKLSRKQVTIDHVYPQDRGGKNTFENCVTSCFPCNNKKQNRTPSEAGMAFVPRGYRPYKPSVMEFYLMKFAEMGIEKTLQDLGVY